MQLKCLIKLYREVIQREDNNEYKETEEMIDRIYTSQSLLNKIKIQQKYLKNVSIMDTVKNREKANCEVYKEIEEVIRNYHLNNFSKNGKGQANELIEYLTSRRTFSNFIRKLWKNYEITNNMYKYTAMVTENAFITPYKKALYSKSPEKGKCPTCNRMATQKHILSDCTETRYDMIKRHDIVVEELYKEIINNKLWFDVDYARKIIYYTGGFLEKGKVIGTIIQDNRLGEKNRLKPDIVFVDLSHIIILDVIVCNDKRMLLNYNIKQNKYLPIMWALRRIYGKKKSIIIPVVFNTYGIVYEESKRLLDAYQIKLDYNKILRQILCKEVDMLMKQSIKYNHPQTD